MTFTDGVILFLTISIVSFILYRMIRKNNSSSCEGCSYAKRSK
ncbi:MAG: hypothetical protein RBT45_01910 [Acholeplasmataceae bacterium]|jgi:hypothetical protein|nr:hypothetical protein [Acholeplasmataceae bacterium]